MIFEITTPPAVEPVSVAEAKNHLRVDIDNDDTLLAIYITAAREYVEGVVRRALITQTLKAYLNAFPGVSAVALPRPPLQSITSLVYTDGDGSDSTFDAANYSADIVAQPGRLVLGYNKSWPSPATLATVNPIAITYVAGYGAAGSDVPSIYRQAILLLAGHWYENREAIIATGAVPKEIPLAVESLLMLDRNW